MPIGTVPTPPYQSENKKGTPSAQRWHDWFRQIDILLEQAFLWANINFTGSDIEDILQKDHNQLDNMQGGDSPTDTEMFHLDSADHATLTGAIVGGVIDHGALGGLADDDHPQYHTDERADDRTAAFFQDVEGLTWDHDDPANTFTPVLAPQLATYKALDTEAFFWSDFGGAISFLQEGPFFAAAASGGGLVSTSALHTDHPGIWCLATGFASAAGRVFILSGTNLGLLHFGVGNEVRIVNWIRTEANLSTALQRYVLRAGFSSLTLPNTVNNGIMFEYQDDQNGGRWQAITHDGIETSTDTGITVAADTWYKLEIIVNSGGTSVEFLIDNVSVATNTTNIPTGTGFNHFSSTHIMKLIGTTQRTLYLDATGIWVAISR